MYCLDTYALAELHNNNPKFKNLLMQNFIIPESTLGEFYYVLLREHNIRTADYWVDKFRSFSKPLNLNIWLKALRFRSEHKENFSVFDCLGYLFSLENGLKFVTGDKEFKGKRGVMFIGK